MSGGVLAAVGLALAGCASGGGSTSDTGESAPKVNSAGGFAAPASRHMVASDNVGRTAGTAAVVAVRTTPGLGRVLVDSEGMTLYDSHGDDPMLYQFDQPPIPRCYEVCAMLWPPLMTDLPPIAAGGAEANLLGTIRRRDGGLQVTYDGHPLYEFADDTQPGETTGDDRRSLGSEWYAMEPDGEEPVGEGR